MKSFASRRNWLKKVSVGMAGLLIGEQVTARLRHNELPPSTFNPGLALVDPKDPIRITRVEIIPVHSLRTIFIKMHTNVGITGIGEGTVEGRINTVIAAIQELEQYLIGKDPRQVAHHWQAIYRHAFYRGGIVLTSALSAVDIAMWDIKGKALGVPIYELLGGPTRDRIRLYGQAQTPEGAKQIMAEGYQSMKVGVTYSRGRLSRYMENPDFIQGVVEQRSYLGKSYVKKPLTMTDGHIIIKGNFDGPGLGLELDDNLIENERGVKEWEFPEMWDSIDGSVLDH